MGGVGTFGVVACVQEVAVTPGELLADADLNRYTMGASEKDEEEAMGRGETLKCSHADTLVRFGKLCVSGGESPPSLVAKPPEFRVKTMNGKV